MTEGMVLICEDGGLTALRLQSTVRRLGYHVIGTAADGEEAVALAARLHPDVVLMDVDMPHLDGLSAARLILAERYLAIIMLSAFGDGETMTAARAAGAVGYLVKPVTDAQIADAIQHALLLAADHGEPTGPDRGAKGGWVADPGPAGVLCAAGAHRIEPVWRSCPFCLQRLWSASRTVRREARSLRAQAMALRAATSRQRELSRSLRT